MIVSLYCWRMLGKEHSLMRFMDDVGPVILLLLGLS